jgi:hypothetical protein
VVGCGSMSELEAGRARYKFRSKNGDFNFMTLQGHNAALILAFIQGLNGVISIRFINHLAIINNYFCLCETFSFSFSVAMVIICCNIDCDLRAEKKERKKEGNLHRLEMGKKFFN